MTAEIVALSQYRAGVRYRISLCWPDGGTFDFTVHDHDLSNFEYGDLIGIHTTDKRIVYMVFPLQEGDRAEVCLGDDVVVKSTIQDIQTQYYGGPDDDAA